MRRSKTSLEEDQKEMRERHLAEQTRRKLLNLGIHSPSNNPNYERSLCIHCNRRMARVGSVYCSRCSVSGMVSELRDTLPGIVKPVVVEKEVPLDFGTLSEPSVVEGDHGASVETSDEELPPEKTYTRSEVARLIGVSPTTLMRWEKKGAIPLPTRIAHNNTCMYTDEHIEAAKHYMKLEYHPEQVRGPVPIGTPQLLPTTVKKTIKLNRRMERAVGRLLR